MDVDYVFLSKEICKRRMISCMSQKELANKSNLSYATIKCIEEGRREKVQRATILKLARGLNCEVNELIGKK